jgi:DNA invertase Pin-like site-specific DNA recombinase
MRTRYMRGDGERASMERNCLYLRKSRADAEAELRGEGETLARHEAALLALAGKMQLNVTAIYREVVSGETIAARPVVQQLLGEVEQGLWDSVLVMEVERLARGDTIDQGIIAQTFKYSGTQIITPVKTYDPANEFDEEYFEFGLFMSRREYKTINRRLQRGRLASVMEGKYVANKAPYGYKRVKLPHDKGYTLEIDPERAETIRLIYDYFVNGEPQENGDRRKLGTYLISRRLNDMQVPSFTGNGWTQASIRDILINPVFIGKIRWSWRANVSRVVDGRRVYSRPRKDLSDCVVVDGLHEAIIDNNLWLAAQDIMASKATPRTPDNRITQNPLSGLVVCGKCGRHMSRRPDTRGKTPPALICAATSCDNVSSYLHYVEAKVLDSLALWLDDYKVRLGLSVNTPTTQLEAKERAIQSLEREAGNLHKQMDNLHNLLEQGVYDTDTFLTRSKLLAERKQENTEALRKAVNDLRMETLREKSKIEIIPKIEALLKVYDTLPTALQKNQLLKEVIEKIEYKKNIGGRWHANPNDFEIVLYPRVARELERLDV